MICLDNNKLVQLCMKVCVWASIVSVSIFPNKSIIINEISLSLAFALLNQMMINGFDGAYFGFGLFIATRLLFLCPQRIFVKLCLSVRELYFWYYSIVYPIVRISFVICVLISIHSQTITALQIDKCLSFLKLFLNIFIIFQKP